MVYFQQYFEQFHKNIKLKEEPDQKAILEKRENVIKKLRQGLKTQFQVKELTPPSFTHFNQGSYAMHTGVRPLREGDYDIDVGIVFNESTDDHSDPVELKQWVLDALGDHTSEVTMKDPCITVQYFKDDEPLYHVDLAIYVDEGSTTFTELSFARGKTGGPAEKKFWEAAEPQKLIERIKNRFSGDDAEQFRRVIKYLKRWKDINFSSSGNAAPIGIGITVAAYHWFSVSKQMSDMFAGSYTYADITAIKNILQQMIANFNSTYYNGETVERLKIELPVEPRADLFEKMTNAQMATLKSKLEQLLEVLGEAESEIDPHEACKKLQRVFGSDFPVPEKSATATKKRKAVVSSSSSGSINACYKFDQ